VGGAQRDHGGAQLGAMTMHAISRRCTILGAVAALCASSAISAHADSIQYHGLGFTVRLPAGIAGKESEGVDFNVYEFSRTADGAVMLGAYSGNAPDFPHAIPDDASKATESINGLRATIYRWTDASGHLGAEVLLELAPQGVVRFPLYIHYWYRNLAEADAGVSDGIIASTMRR
jgi:hypothetical protein